MTENAIPNARCFLRGETTVHQMDDSSSDNNQKNALQNRRDLSKTNMLTGLLRYFYSFYKY